VCVGGTGRWWWGRRLRIGRYEWAVDGLGDIRPGAMWNVDCWLGLYVDPKMFVASEVIVVPVVPI